MKVGHCRTLRNDVMKNWNVFLQTGTVSLSSSNTNTNAIVNSRSNCPRRPLHTTAFNPGEKAPVLAKTTAPQVSDIISSFFDLKKRLFGRRMSYVVIGVSGVTCGGKTSLTKLLQRKFPQALVKHQDHYFYDDDYPGHVRCPEAENHVNYEIMTALNMEQMYRDVQEILKAPPKLMEPPKEETKTGGVGDKAETPNFDDSFLKQVPDIDFDVSKYSTVPILIIEGFTMFASEYLYEICDARFFCTLDKAACKQRRSLREYTPPDTPNFFDKVVWPEYEKHFQGFIDKRPGITVFDGSIPIEEIWRRSVEVVVCRIEEKLNEGGQANKTNAIVP